jgi:hypothetical protein
MRLATYEIICPRTLRHPLFSLTDTLLTVVKANLSQLTSEDEP